MLTQGSVHDTCLLSLSHLPVSSQKKAVEAKCSLACEYLSEEDYMDLLWTTLSEFPGEGPGGGGAGAGKSETGSCSSGGSTWCYLQANRISTGAGDYFFNA